MDWRTLWEEVRSLKGERRDRRSGLLKEKGVRVTDQTKTTAMLEGDEGSSMKAASLC